MRATSWRYVFVSSLVAVALACSSHQTPKAPASEPSASRGSARATGLEGGEASAPNPAHVELAMRTAAMAENGAPAYAEAVGFAESVAVRNLPPGESVSDDSREQLESEAAENRIVKNLVPSVRTSGIRPVDPVVQSVLGAPGLGAPIVTVDGLNNTDNLNAFALSANP